MKKGEERQCTKGKKDTVRTEERDVEIKQEIQGNSSELQD